MGAELFKCMFAETQIALPVQQRLSANNDRKQFQLEFATASSKQLPYLLTTKDTPENYSITVKITVKM